jgi:hypothetical protein
MKAGKYTVRELFVNSYIEQIVIPEIQRDYVWGEEQVKGILDSIKEDFEVFGSATVDIQADDIDLKRLFEDFYKKQKYSSNIGFIYAYNDPEYTGKYFLIDGQQRITTIYLLLLALSIKTDRSIFIKYYHTNNILKLDYRVREAAHLFLKNFVNYYVSDENPSIDQVEKQHWFFDANKLDPTINSIISNFKTILSYLDKNDLNKASFLDYIQHYIEFWYFDTNLSDQGEELYIYMNARGEQIQPNENLKADLLGSLKNEDLKDVVNREDYNEGKDLNGLKNYWGKKWEEWQDFFWRNRGDNDNADIGFNEFINCIAGLEFYKVKLSDENFSTKALDKLLSLQLIETHIKTLKFLETEKVNFIERYSYSSVDKYYNLIWSFFNKTEYKEEGIRINRNTNWFENYLDNNKGNERNNMVLLWSLFLYPQVKGVNLDSDDFFRVMRLFYLRFFNYNRSVSKLVDTVEKIASKGLFSETEVLFANVVGTPMDETDTKLRTEEETKKYKFLSQFIAEPEVLRAYESLIWQIEDHKYNIDGSSLGNINISHLVDFSSNPTIEDLQKIRDRFYHLMSFDQVNKEETLITLLLHYGVFWHRDSPTYYYNFKFDNWRNIIRDKNSNVGTFKKFFTEYMGTNEIPVLTEILNSKNQEFLSKHIESLFEITDFDKQLIVYSLLLDDIWGAGKHMCYDEINQTRLFYSENAIFNARRYRDGGWFYLWDECIKKYGDRETMKTYLEQCLKNNNLI